MIHRLNVEELSVETFDPNVIADPMPTAEPIVWTGCMSECTECGTIGGFTIGNQINL